VVRKVLRPIHRWIGLMIALPVALQGVTGAILAVADMVPDQHTTPAPPRPAGEIVAAAKQAMGPDAHATRYVAQQAVGQVARVEIAAPGKMARSVRVDPATLTVLGAEPVGSGALGWIRSLHVQFLAADYGGRSIGGWFGIGLLVMLASAVPLWWPHDRRWKRAFTTNFRARGVVFHRRLHGAAGIWIIVALLVLTVTGIGMAFPRTARSVLGLEQREPPRPPKPGDIAAAPATDIDRAIGLAQQALPGTTVRLAVLPPRADEPVRLELNRSGEGGAAGAIQVQVDMAAGRVRAVAIQSPGSRRTASTAGCTIFTPAAALATGGGYSRPWQASRFRCCR
jgi:uncharacterized iron-regulated membrane protein